MMSRDSSHSVTQRKFLGLNAIIASPVMERLMEVVERVARTNAAVLVVGETGSGKELVARAIHHYSIRSGKPWVDVNCGVLPEHLMESELFGYEKGAFSGANSPKAGFFELADQGTLFLDEIGELDARMQVKLLRVLDGVPYYRLGGTRKVAVDTRIVTATNQNLEQLVNEGKFRKDLFHRLNQISIEVPPLRERPEDIEALAGHFLAAQNPDAVLSDGAKQALKAHTWPGNIRELRNVIVKAAVFASGSEIQPGDLGFGKSAAPQTLEQQPAANLNHLERKTIVEMLTRTNGHQKRAAELLGISTRTLSRKMKLYATEAGVGMGWQEMERAS